MNGPNVGPFIDCAVQRLVTNRRFVQAGDDGAALRHEGGAPPNVAARCRPRSLRTSFYHQTLFYFCSNVLLFFVTDVSRRLVTTVRHYATKVVHHQMSPLVVDHVHFERPSIIKRSSIFVGMSFCFL
jgi:hypothetical protein